MAVVASLSHYTVLFTLAALAFPHETLATHFTVFQDIAHTPYVALVGIVIVGFSSALGSFIGGAMNDVYIPVQDREVRNGSSTLIYQKRANAGIANQIMGVCDTLILGVVYNRSVQSASP